MIGLLCLAGCRLFRGESDELLSSAPGIPDGVVQASYQEVGEQEAAEILAEDPPGFYETTVVPSLPKNIKKLVRGEESFETRRRAEAIARRYFQAGEELFAKQEYDAAADEYAAAARQLDDSSIQEDSLFMVAESYFFADRYSAASKTYAELLKKYDNSRYLNQITARQFAIGRYWIESDKTQSDYAIVNLTEDKPFWQMRRNALAAYENIRLNDSTGPLADDAVMATAVSHFEQEHFNDADYYFTLLRNEYPQSEHQPTAHLLGIRAKLEKYEGPRYDSAPLEEAEEVIEQALVQFPTELASERENLLKFREVVHAQKAEREWAMGEYYATNSYYGAAREYYQGILQEYPDTPFAEMARERIERYQDKPDAPKQKFPWLVKVFSSQRKRW